jgi:hypothetical protein
MGASADSTRITQHPARIGNYNPIGECGLDQNQVGEDDAVNHVPELRRIILNGSKH